MKVNIYKYLAIALLSLVSAGCKDDGPKTHDSSAPIILNRFYPTSGGVGTEILLTGRNFTEDPSEVSVKVGDRELVVLGANMTNILVTVPKKLGDGKLEVSIAGREAVSTLESFTYTYSAIVTTLAGDGNSGYADGPGEEALFHFDDYDYDVPDDNKGWRKGSICTDSQGNVYVGDIINHCIRKITPGGEVSTLAGMPGVSASVDGTGSGARFQYSYGMDTDAQDNIWVTDVTGKSIRKITPQGVVTTVTSTPFDPWYLAVDRRNGHVYLTQQGDDVGGIYKYDPAASSDNFTTVITGANYTAVAVDADGNLYASNATTHTIEKLTQSGNTWTREVFAGSTQGLEDGTFEEAKFSSPRGLAINSSGDVFVAGNGSWDGGKNDDQSIRRIDMAGGRVITIAGSGTSGYVDAIGGAAAFDGPQDIAVDREGVLYVFDKMNNAIRKIVYE